MENNKVKCSIEGCGVMIERADALVPALKTLAAHLKRRVRLDDLDAFVVCPACARAFVDAAKAGGTLTGQMFHKIGASETFIRRQIEERKARAEAEAEARRRNILTSPIGQMFNLKVTETGTNVVNLHAVPTPEADEKPAAKAPRKRAPKKEKAAG